MPAAAGAGRTGRFHPECLVFERFSRREPDSYNVGNRTQCRQALVNGVAWRLLVHGIRGQHAEHPPTNTDLHALSNHLRDAVHEMWRAYAAGPASACGGLDSYTVRILQSPHLQGRNLQSLQMQSLQMQIPAGVGRQGSAERLTDGGRLVPVARQGPANEIEVHGASPRKTILWAADCSCMHRRPRRARFRIWASLRPWRRT